MDLRDARRSQATGGDCGLGLGIANAMASGGLAGILAHNNPEGIGPMPVEGIEPRGQVAA